MRDHEKFKDGDPWTIAFVDGDKFMKDEKEPRGARSTYLKHAKRKGSLPLANGLYYKQFWFFGLHDMFCVVLKREDDQFYVSHRQDEHGVYDLGPFRQAKTAAAMCRLMEATYSTFEEFRNANPRHEGSAGKDREGEGSGDSGSSVLRVDLGQA